MLQMNCFHFYVLVKQTSVKISILLHVFHAVSKIMHYDLFVVSVVYCKVLLIS